MDAAATRPRRAPGRRPGRPPTTPRPGGAGRGGARAATEPVREEAVVRGSAALAELRGQVTAAEIDKLARKRRRRARTGRVAKRVALVGLLGAGVFAAWKWWDKQTNPDWLVEPRPPRRWAAVNR
ncbi:DUF5324 family protein [Streptomyces sp. M19]